MSTHLPKINTPEDYRAAIQVLGLTQAGLARTMTRLGDDRDYNNILRSIERMLAGTYRISGEMRTVLGCLALLDPEKVQHLAAPLSGARRAA